MCGSINDVHCLQFSRRALVLESVAQGSSHAREKLSNSEWLFDVVGPEGETHILWSRGLAQKDDDGNLGESARSTDTPCRHIWKPRSSTTISGAEVAIAFECVAAGHRLERLVSAGGRHGLDSVDLGFIVNDQRSNAAHAAIPCRGCSGMGKRNPVRVPRFRTAGLCARIVPIASTKPRQIASPRPVPALRPSIQPPR